MLKIKFIVATLVFAIVFIGCEDRTDLTAPKPNAVLWHHSNGFNSGTFETCHVIEKISRGL